MSERKITAATTNPAKLLELRRLIGDLASVVPLPFVADDPAWTEPPDELGETIEKIAASKAAGWSRVLAARGLDSLTIASDGGLLIPTLGDAWDLRRTRRFAGEGASDRERSQCLLDLAIDLPDDERTISWQEAVAIADQGRLVGVWSASGATGRLARTLRPDLLEHAPGFWVPALWEVPAFNFRRLAELTPDERERLGDHWTELRASVRAGLARHLDSLSHSDKV